MDQRLVTWARAVKARRRRADALPVLWLFTDPCRVPDPLPAIAALPRGLCGVVFRHDGVPGRADLALAVAKLCRKRRLWLSIAGDARLAARLGAGVHLRGRAAPGWYHAPFRTGSAHGAADIHRLSRLGIDAIFVSPVFATLSHPGVLALGTIRFAALSGLHASVFALGGIDGASTPGLPRRRCAGAGAIGALA